MESLLSDKWEVELKQPSSEALQRWRDLCAVVKNPKRRFRFTANIAKRQQAGAIRKTNQETKIEVENQHAFSNKFLRTPSHRAIDIEPEISFSGIDKLLLSELVREKNVNHLHQFGGVSKLVTDLRSHPEEGIKTDGEGIYLRRKAFGWNAIHKPSQKGLSEIMLETFKDPIIVVLLLSALFALGFGIKADGLKGSSDGLFVLFSIFAVVATASFSKIWPEREFHKISKSNNDISTIVIRDGKEQQIPANDVVVGDVVCLQIGYQVPADGLYIDGDSFIVNESFVTKETISLVYIKGYYRFLLAGSKVTNGSARMLVTAVGENTKWGEVSRSTRATNDRTPLQMKLQKLTQNTAKVGVAIGSMVLVVLLIRYYSGIMKDDSGTVDYHSNKKSIIHIWQSIFGILATSIVIASTAIPEGLLLAATVALAYSTKRMAAENVLVRNLSAFEAIGSITVICVDKSSLSKTLKVKNFWLGGKDYSKKGTHTQLAAEVLQLIHEGVGLNSTSRLSFESNELQTEETIRDWAVQELEMDLGKLKENCIMLNPKKQGSVYIQRNNDNNTHIHMRGSADMILARCSHYYKENGEIKEISDNEREELKKMIQEMNSIGFVHAVVSREFDDDNEKSLRLKLKEKNLTLIGVLALEDIPRPGIREVLKQCHQAKIGVKMITSEDVAKAKASAVDCGILGSDQITNTGGVIEGIEFRNYTKQERLGEVVNCRVFARASITDKLLFVKSLKQKGHVVAVVGGHTRDGIVLEEADVGFYIVEQEAESVKQNLDIVITGDSFTSIAKALKWGRSIIKNIRTLIEFQLTATISSLVIDSVTTIFAGEPPNIKVVTAVSAGEVPFAAFQILWVKLIVGTLVVLALTVDYPAESLMQQKPVDQREPFITNIMCRNIIGQALCQIIILLIIQFKGETTFKLNAREKDTLIFNIFVLCQISTILKTVKCKNICERKSMKKLFWIVILIIILLQILIVELLKRFAGTERLNWKQWRACIGVAAISWLIGWSVRNIPIPKKRSFCCICI